MTIVIKQLNSQQADFNVRLTETLAWDTLSSDSVESAVDEILADVKKRGDQALVDWTNKFDGIDAASINDVRLDKQVLKNALNELSPAHAEALSTAAARIKRYHEKQKQGSWQYTDEDGSVLGQQVTPIEKVGIYVPGGKASYPSTVLMDAIPAKVAGVKSIVATVPAPGGELNPLVLAALALADVDEVYTVGGAQAIAALAYGTQSIPRVDKIVGPGNIYVATAKKKVFGQVGIDMVAGPSEILVICDGKTNPDWIAMDLFSQAEHDEDAQSILISPDQQFLDQVLDSINTLLPGMERKDIITASLLGRGVFIKVNDLQEAVVVSNRIAPEHLELSVDNPQTLLENISNAGAIFLGRYTSEALGDYCAGPSHVLPTSGTARFSSALGVYDFQKRSSVIQCTELCANELADIASTLARAEGLTAHARAAEFRKKQ